MAEIPAQQTETPAHVIWHIMVNEMVSPLWAFIYRVAAVQDFLDMSRKEGSHQFPNWLLTTRL